jgi:hypothetical protein
MQVTSNMIAGGSWLMWQPAYTCMCSPITSGARYIE